MLLPRPAKALALAALCFLLLACGAAVETSHILPDSPEQAQALRNDGYLWSEPDIRRLYKERAALIGTLDQQWSEAGVPIEERALRAYDARRNARLTAREMMVDPRHVEALRERDLKKYGDPDGPTFDWLVEKARQKGHQGDAIYQYIIESSQRTQ